MTAIQHDVSAPAMRVAIERNLSAFYEHARHLPSAAFHDDAHGTCFSIEQPVEFFNVILRAAFARDAIDAQIAATLAPFRVRRVPVRWWIGPSTTPANLGECLQRHGLIHVENPPGMAVDLHSLNDDIPPPTGLVVRRVEDGETLARFIVAYTRTFSLSESDTRLWADLFARLCDPAGPYPHYVALLDGKPVATAMLFLGGGSAGLYHLGTVAEARGRGVGAAITLAPLREARDRGYRVATLQSTPMGYSLYRRVGFVEYCRLGMYRLPVAPG